MHSKKAQRLTSCPLPLGNVRTPALPVLLALSVRLEAFLFLAEVFLIFNENHGEYSAGLRVDVCRSQQLAVVELLAKSGVDGGRREKTDN